MTLPPFILKHFFKNYLKVFADIDKQEYPAENKKAIIDKFIEVSKTVFAKNHLTYDIGGKRIGLSKGSSLIGEKALNNRIEKYGYPDIDSITTVVTGSNGQSMLSFLHQLNDRPAHCQITFTWDYKNHDNADTAIFLFTQLSQMVEVAYGYSYLASLRTSIVGETKTNMVGTTYRPGSEQAWDKKIGLIKEGIVKKIYPVNCFNQNQQKKVEDKFDRRIRINNGKLEICILNS